MTILLSKEQLEKLKKELEYLISEEKPKVAERLKNAASYGDLSENAEYDEALMAKERLERKIFELQKIIAEAKVIKNNNQDSNKITPGKKFEVTELSSKKKYTFILVGFGEANPKDKKISTESPLGKAFLNKKVGEIVKVQTPQGEQSYKINRIVD
ncbi:MAG: transcription elongation factor GreA [Patescibacteria group bacterium]|nr:transcription elongation factor GreA [Patescibacteria group bacterium]